MAETLDISIPANLDDLPSVRALLTGAIPGAITGMVREKMSGHVDSGAALAGWEPANALQYPYRGDDHVLGVINPTPQAQWLEEGRGGFHLASRWGRRGGRWKVGKGGRLYAHVPFRVRTPVGAPGDGAVSSRRRLGAAMPVDVYARAKGLPHKGRLTGFGDTYKQGKSYDYYRRAFEAFPQELDDVRGYEWAASQFEGMFRTTATTPAGGRHTAYMTIRTITPNSPGWYIPPTPAHGFLKETMTELAPRLQQLVEQAAERDTAAALADAAKEL